MFRRPPEHADTDGQTQLDARSGEKIASLPRGGYNNHWTRNLLVKGNKLLVSVGSASNIGEHGMAEEERRACILQMDSNGANDGIFAHGLRNPVGMAVHPVTGQLYTVVNERDLVSWRCLL